MNRFLSRDFLIIEGEIIERVPMSDNMKKWQSGYSTEDNAKKAENIEKLGDSLKSNELRIR